MPPPLSTSLGEAIGRALETLELSQADLAKLIPVDSSQISKWIHGRHRPSREHLKRLVHVLGDAFDWNDVQGGSNQLYIASPITSVAPEYFRDSYNATARVVKEIRKVVEKVYWPGEGIRTLDQVLTPSVATEANLAELHRSAGLAYIQFKPVQDGSSALLELGMALGLAKRTTVIIDRSIEPPYALRSGFEGVAERIPFLPEAHLIYSNIDDVCREIRNTGARFFGLTGSKVVPLRKENDLLAGLDGQAASETL